MTCQPHHEQACIQGYGPGMPWAIHTQNGLYTTEDAYRLEISDLGIVLSI